MQPEKLISLTAAKGIQFGHVGGGGTPEWTAQDAAMACMGLPPRVFWALVYTYAGDASVHDRLMWELWGWGHWMREHAEAGQDWPRSFNRGPYMLDLCRLLLVEVAQPWRFAADVKGGRQPDQRRIAIGASPHQWSRQLEPVYKSLRAEFETWVGIGRSRMRLWLREGFRE